MRILIKPSVLYALNITNYINAFIQERQNGAFKTFLLNNQVIWTTEVDNYNVVLGANNILNPQVLVNFSLYSRQFENQYNSPRGTHIFIRALRNSSKGSLCSYCGSPACGTLDHYYPKSEFPQYAIVPDNLIPCCYRCNKIKDEFYPSVVHNRIINPYFDTFLNNYIFKVDFNLIQGVLTFSLQANNNVLNPQQTDIVNFHILTLELQSFHAEAILSEFDNIKSLVAIQRNSGITDNQIINMYRALVMQGQVDNKTHNWSLIIMNSIINNQNNYNLL